MKKNLSVINFLWLFLISVASASAGKLSVGKNGDFSTIRQGIASAKAGDTLFVLSGWFGESNLTIDKPLFVVGQNFPEIDAQSSGEIFTVKSSFVEFYGITFKNSGVSYIKDNAAIKFVSVDHCIVQNCRFTNNFFSIYFSKSAFCRASGNEIHANGETEAGSGNGIHCWSCRGMTIENNRIFGQRDGIYMEFSRQSEIRNNYSEGNLRYGLHFMFSDSCRYTGNTFRKNGSGVAVMYTHWVEMSDNVFDENWGAASYGILLKDISDSHIFNNTFVKNTIGLYAEGSSRILIEHNSFLRNGWAVKIMANSSEDFFTRNNFEGNTFDVATNSRSNFNVFSGNFWSAYQGYDLNRDGVGDAPFRPVRLFSLLVEQNPPALLLLRSLFIDILDAAERVLPALTPETLVDYKPAMKRIL